MRTTASNSTATLPAGEFSLGVAVTRTVFGVVPLFSSSSPAIETTSVPSRRSDAQADQVRAVDPLEALGDDGLDAQQAGALGRPVARGAGAVLLAAEDHQRRSGRLVVLRGVVDERLRAVGLREVAGVATLDVLKQLVAQTDVGERAADHDLVVAAARAVGVEVAALNAVLQQVC